MLRPFVINALHGMGIPTVTTNTDLENSNRLFYVGSNYYECGCTTAGLMGLLTGGRANQLRSCHAACLLLEKYPLPDALCFTAAGVHAGCQAVLDMKWEKNIRSISFDDVESTREMIRRGMISATICQQPFQQGSKPIKLLFDNLTLGVCPEESLLYTEASIKIYENL